MATLYHTKYLLLLISYLIQVDVTATVIENHFATKVQEITHYKDTSGINLGEFTYRGVSKCVRACQNVSDCRSFFYHKVNKTCQLQAELFEDTGTLSYVANTQYYKMVKVQSNFTCLPSPPPAVYTSVLLSDNTVFIYRIEWNNKKKLDAESICASDGASLVRVLTEAKMQTLLTLLNTCADYIGNGNYWIDGSNSNAIDFFDIRQWTTSLQEPLPPTDQFWATPVLTAPDKDHCVVLSMDHGYKWINTKCDYPAKNYFICEK